MSARLGQAAAKDAGATCTVNAMLSEHLAAEEQKSAADRIARLPDVTNVSHLRHLGIVSISTPLTNLPALAAMDEVTWIDLDATAPITGVSD